MSRAIAATVLPQLAELFALFEQVSQWALKAKDISACASLGTPTSLSLENLIRQQLSPLYQSLNASPDTTPAPSAMVR